MKKITVFLCLLMALCLLCACGSQNAPAGSGAADPASSGESASIEKSPNAAYEAHYYENGVATCIEQFDADRRLLNCEGDISDEYHYYEEYVRNDYAAGMDLSDMLAMDGVTYAECTQVSYQQLNGSGELEPQSTLMAFGYNDAVRLNVIRLYYYVDGMEAPVLVYQVAFDLNEQGDPVHAVKTAGNGEVIFERNYENTYDENGILMYSMITGTFYGDVTFQDGVSIRDTLETPVEFESAVEYTLVQ